MYFQKRNKNRGGTFNVLPLKEVLKMFVTVTYSDFRIFNGHMAPRTKYSLTNIHLNHMNSQRRVSLQQHWPVYPNAQSWYNHTLLSQA